MRFAFGPNSGFARRADEHQQQNAPQQRRVNQPIVFGDVMHAGQFGLLGTEFLALLLRQKRLVSRRVRRRFFFVRRERLCGFGSGFFNALFFFQRGDFGGGQRLILLDAFARMIHAFPRFGHVRFFFGGCEDVARDHVEPSRVFRLEN